MTNSISHRGPDHEGTWIEKNVGIGHTRLSIIDISSAGNQPMISKNKRFILSYNGEIYNYKKLRSLLTAKGFQFNSNTDTEVVLNSLICWGSDAISKFNGMFALAFWDREEKKLLLARDRYGIKPLYFSEEQNYFSFGSEQKAILANYKCNKKINEEALLEYFTFQNIFTDQTFFKNIKIIQPGFYKILKFEDDKIKSSIDIQYWDYQFNQDNSIKNNKSYLEELRSLFEQAIYNNLISDVEIGSYLSGGIDSGTITAITKNKFSNLKTFTCGFDLSSASGIELSYDERDKARLMSNMFKTDHFEFVLKSGDMEKCINKLVWHLEEPRVGQSYPNFYASKLASKHVKVVLSGTGGDELFGGYPWRYYHSANSQNFEDYVDNYYLYWQRLINNIDIKELFSPIWNNVKHVWTRDIFKNVFKNHKNNLKSPEDYINHSLYFEAKTFLHGLFLVEDKLSMAHSIETRVPFMDNDLVDFALKCPVNFKIKNLKRNLLNINENEFINKKNYYFQKTSDGKNILRDMMRAYIPKEILYNKKQGFSSPDASWFKKDSIQFVKKTLFSKDTKIYNFFNPKQVKKLVNEHLNGVKNRRLFIWSLLYFEIWLNKFYESR